MAVTATASLSNSPPTDLRLGKEATTLRLNVEENCDLMRCAGMMAMMKVAATPAFTSKWPGDLEVFLDRFRSVLNVLGSNSELITLREIS